MCLHCCKNIKQQDDSVPCLLTITETKPNANFCIQAIASSPCDNRNRDQPFHIDALSLFHILGHSSCKYSYGTYRVPEKRKKKCELNFHFFFFQALTGS